MHRTAPTKQNHLVQNMDSVEAEKPCLIQMLQIWLNHNSEIKKSLFSLITSFHKGHLNRTCLKLYVSIQRENIYIHMWSGRNKKTEEKKIFLFIKVFTYNFQGTRNTTFFLRHYAEKGEEQNGYKLSYSQILIHYQVVILQIY